MPPCILGIFKPAALPSCIRGYTHAITIVLMNPCTYACHHLLIKYPFICIPLLRPSCNRMYTHIISIAIKHPCAYSYHHQHVLTHVTTIAIMCQCAYASSSSPSYIHVRTHHITIDIMCSVEDNKYTWCTLVSVYFKTCIQDDMNMPSDTTYLHFHQHHVSEGICISSCMHVLKALTAADTEMFKFLHSLASVEHRCMNQERRFSSTLAGQQSFWGRFKLERIAGTAGSGIDLKTYHSFSR
ncbi:hypothetical protein CEXT_535771 [Caerostris extrusa]|uniref:Uncharacterized protein n=1 Tax=Caerostris extrusa TaxID=172846 RepID=A0AAV4W021_CAEEX|nr:hypothetical protein CEXT_535771 [Caerostris extrusa]